MRACCDRRGEARGAQPACRAEGSLVSRKPRDAGAGRRRTRRTLAYAGGCGCRDGPRLRSSGGQQDQVRNLTASPPPVASGWPRLWRGPGLVLHLLRCGAIIAVIGGAISLMKVVNSSGDCHSKVTSASCTSTFENPAASSRPPSACGVGRESGPGVPGEHCCSLVRLGKRVRAIRGIGVRGGLSEPSRLG